MNSNVKTVFVKKLAMVSKCHGNQEQSNYINNETEQCFR